MLYSKLLPVAVISIVPLSNTGQLVGSVGCTFVIAGKACTVISSTAKLLQPSGVVNV